MFRNFSTGARGIRHCDCRRLSELEGGSDQGGGRAASQHGGSRGRVEMPVEEGSGTAPRLLDRVRSRMRALHYSIRTEEQYTALGAALRRFPWNAPSVRVGRAACLGVPDGACR